MKRPQCSRLMHTSLYSSSNYPPGRPLLHVTYSYLPKLCPPKTQVQVREMLNWRVIQIRQPSDGPKNNRQKYKLLTVNRQLKVKSAHEPSGLHGRSLSRFPYREVRVRALAGSLCCVLGQDTLLSQCLSPPRSINGYRVCW